MLLKSCKMWLRSRKNKNAVQDIAQTQTSLLPADPHQLLLLAPISPDKSSVLQRIKNINIFVHSALCLMIKYFMDTSLAGRNLKKCARHSSKLGVLFHFSKILKENKMLLQVIMGNLNLSSAS